MKVLFCGGSAKAPSWAMRGIQIASTRPNWMAKNHPLADDIAAADIFVVVKRPPLGLLAELRRTGKPIVWDALDFWSQQPDAPVPQNKKDALEMAADYIRMVRPRGLIAANKAMANDLRMMAPAVTHIYHHARLTAAPITGAGRTVVFYDGDLKHAQQIMHAAARFLKPHGWTLETGAPDHRAAALLAGRDHDQRQWLARRWKSNVKAANAIAYGLPVLAHPEQGALETLPEQLAIWFDGDIELKEAIDRLCTNTTPLPPSAEEVAATTLQAAAQAYEQFFETL